jgi:hypothetical protein
MVELTVGQLVKQTVGRLKKLKCGAVVQLVRMLACHAGGRGFKSRPLRQFLKKPRKKQYFGVGNLNIFG